MLILNLTVLFFAGLREITKTNQVTLHFDKSLISLHDLVVCLIKKYSKLKEIVFQKISQKEIDDYLGNVTDFQITQVKFAKNRKILTDTTQNAVFSDGDTIAIFLPLMGG